MLLRATWRTAGSVNGTVMAKTISAHPASCAGSDTRWWPCPKAGSPATRTSQAPVTAPVTHQCGCRDRLARTSASADELAGDLARLSDEETDPADAYRRQVQILDRWRLLHALRHRTCAADRERRRGRGPGRSSARCRRA